MGKNKNIDWDKAWNPIMYIEVGVAIGIALVIIILSVGIPIVILNCLWNKGC